VSFSVFGFSVPAWTFALVCAAVFTWELGRLWLALTSELWPSVLGTVHEARIESRPDSDGDDFFVPVLRYTYRVGGQLYEGKRLAFHPKGSYKYNDLIEAMSGVTVGASHKVHFHPRYRRLCTLKAGAGMWNYVLLALLFSLAIAAMYAQVDGGA
jgi:Protein of unknown function (DUF3592)